jgi:hypothetical protein
VKYGNDIRTEKLRIKELEAERILLSEDKQLLSSEVEELNKEVTGI